MHPMELRPRRLTCYLFPTLAGYLLGGYRSRAERRGSAAAAAPAHRPERTPVDLSHPRPCGARRSPADPAQAEPGPGAAPPAGAGAGPGGAEPGGRAPARRRADRPGAADLRPGDGDLSAACPGGWRTAASPGGPAAAGAGVQPGGPLSGYAGTQRRLHVSPYGGREAASAEMRRCPDHWPGGMWRCGWRIWRACGTAGGRWWGRGPGPSYPGHGNPFPPGALRKDMPHRTGSSGPERARRSETGWGRLDRRRWT